MPQKIVLWMGIVLAGLCTGCAMNPLTGGEELMLFPVDKDIEMGRHYAPEVEKALGGRIPDEALQDYINSVGQRLARVSHRPDLLYQFTAVQDEMLNAIAVPGGHVFVTRGLLEKLQSESQLAGILGHEVCHVVARDSAAALSRQYGMTAVLAAVAVSGAPSRAVGATAFTTQILSLSYSRQDEREADEGGMDYMVHAGYDPQGTVETMKTLLDLQTFRPVEFFSTHPSPENRIEYMTERISDRYSNVGPLKVGKEEFNTQVLQKLKTLKKPPRSR